MIEKGHVQLRSDAEGRLLFRHKVKYEQKGGKKHKLAQIDVSQGFQTSLLLQ